MRLSAAIVLALAVLLVVAPMGVVAATPSAPLPTGSAYTQVDTETASGAPLEPAEPRQVIRIAVTDDGDAIWTIESRFHLQSETDRDEFEAYADAITAGDRDAGYDTETLEQFRQLAAASTDREMHLEDAGWDDPRIESVDDGDHELGVISYSATWSNFTVVDGGYVYLGDAFQSGDGTWFPELTEEQRLVIERPANSTFEDVPRGLEDGALVWIGPYEFDENELQVTFQIGNNGAGGGDGNGSETPPTSFFDGLLSPTSIVAGFGLLVLLAVVGIGGYLLASRERLADLIRRAGLDTTASEPTSDEPPTGEAAASSVEFDDSSVKEAEEVDVELLSDEERVLRLLHQNGGRMKQAMIVKETGWSNAKVSQLLSKMDEDDEIEKLRIGRENLITLPEIDLTEIE
ncbi:helix-turn-helix transcriptional regulator [Natronobeatus ordinarius]|uniref:helix-turn-helix transcriptional regulator n=1 Tax=Natronobeatus ordinarius TaxID=2963433 RepID=UPI0020CFE796|nr:hypothetical protein [Natronobeatus ordinarius]